MTSLTIIPKGGYMDLIWKSVCVVLFICPEDGTDGPPSMGGGGRRQRWSCGLYINVSVLPTVCPRIS